MKKFTSFLLPLLLITSCEQYDDTALWNAINENSAKIQALQTQVDNLNRRADELKSLIDAVDKKESIKEISELSDGTGYTILFTSGRSIVIHHGANGKDGKDGSTPVISVKQDTDGIWCWTLNGSWLLNEKGEKIAASAKDGKDGTDGNDGNDGHDGKDGTDGKDGVTPQLKIENDYWYVSTDNGATWTKLEKATGENGKDGDAFFKEVRQDEENAYFVLVDGTVITLPLASATRFNIVLDTDTVPILDAGEAKTIKYTITKATDNTIVKTIAQNGWVATVNQKTKDSGDIIVQAPNPIVASEILVFASDGEGHTVMAVLDCVKGQCTVAKNSYSVNSDGGDIDLVVTTNMPYNIVIPSEAQSWISLKPETKATITETKTLVIGKNTEYQKRFATVILTDTENNTIQTIEVLQDAAAFNGDLSITVSSEGTLSSVLSSYSYTTIKSISISGPLNDADYKFIKNSLTSLRSLDLSGATGVEPNFKNHSSTLDLVILPSCQTSISESAFNAASIVKIVLPENLQSIGNYAFYNCSKMTGAVTVPKTVNYIGTKAFDGTKIESFTLADGIQLTKFEESSLPPTITALRIPASIISLNYTDFTNLKSLKSLSFEDDALITEIPSLCFANLPLETVTLPKSLQKIGGKVEADSWTTSVRGVSMVGGAFERCTKLQSITIPKNVEVIEPSAFHNSGLRSVIFEEGSKIETLSGWTISGSYGANRIGAFSSTNIETLSVPSNVIEIQDAAFANCSSLRSIDFSAAKSLKTIGGCYDDPTMNGVTRGAFISCTGLQSLTIPASVEVIQAGAFDGCTGLVSIAFEANSHLSKISGAYHRYNSTSYNNVIGAFSNCKNITKITIPASVEVIEAGAFLNCSSLTTIDFESGSKCKQITGIKDETFAYGPFTSTKVQKLTLPSSIKTISSYSLSRMSYLTSIKIADGAIVSFKTLAFIGSDKLSEIDASNASFSAAARAFAYIYDSEPGRTTVLEYCPISIVKIGAVNPPACDTNSFGDVSKAKLYVPSESIDYYKLEDGWKKFGTILSL